MALRLDQRDQGMLAGDEGEAARLAMRIVARMAEISGARRLIDVSSAHIDGCLYHGRASLDFAERLVDGRARVSVPTTLNVGSLDLLHPELYQGDPQTGHRARRLMDLYEAMGCRPTWTCAPYQLPEHRPEPGEHVAWAESNAIVFANSVLGARTDRYGDFIDICAAITGRVPDAGLHRDEGRRGEILFRLKGVPSRLLQEDVFYPVLGHLIGTESGTKVPVIDGLPAGVTEDQLKAVGAAASSSGSVALFHVVGVTPEAPTLGTALQGGEPLRTLPVTPESVARARDSLTTAGSGRLAAVSVGTPHFSVGEFQRLVSLVEGTRPAEGVDFYVSTGRGVLAEVKRRGWLCSLEEAGVQVVTDTCTYVTPILRNRDGVVMTNSGKWAYYAPGNLGIDVAFGSLSECVRSAAGGGSGGTRPCGPVFEGRVLVPGEARGRLLLLEEPLSFWGGVDPRSGDIIDRHHPQVGRSVTGAIVAMPSGRGSSSSSSVLAESIRAGTGPAGIILTEDDRIVALGALVAAELYGASIPVVVCKADDLSTLESGREIWIEGPTVSVEEPQPG